MNKQYFGYIRVSTVKQGEGVSLEAQREAIERYCATQDLAITRWFEEKETAAKRGRPIFTEMIKLLRAGKAKGVVMHKIDRSARNLRDWATVGDLSDAGIDVHFAAESVDFASRGGRLTADIQAVIAADYIRNLREETIKGLDGRLKQGLYPFKAPIGYLDNGGGKLKTICPVKGPKVRHLFKVYAAGEHSLWSLVDEAKRIGLTSHGNAKIGKTTIENMISNPFYVGLMRVSRQQKTYQGKHEALISSALFEQVRAVRARRTVKKVTKHGFDYRRIFRCARCQTAIIPERQKGHAYYRCHTKGCTSGSLREEAIENSISTQLRKYQLNIHAAGALQGRLGRWGERVLETERADTTALEMSKIANKKAQLLDALLDGLIDKQVFEARNAQFLLQEKALSETSQKTIDPAWFRVQSAKLLELLKTLCLSHSLAIPAEKRRMLETLFSNRLVSGKNVELQPVWWLERTSEWAAFHVGPPSHATSRRGQEIPELEYEDFLRLFMSQKWIDLTECIQEIYARKQEQFENCPHDIKITQ
ncbi:recombinase family protein [Planktotalea sp.]|uniref:recombinase family protein n=1 Tax=Planktotalea sp. TaxID=2029877 RepID=UPI003D6BD71D